MIPALNKTSLPKFKRNFVKEGVRKFGGQKQTLAWYTVKKTEGQH